MAGVRADVVRRPSTGAAVVRQCARCGVGVSVDTAHSPRCAEWGDDSSTAPSRGLLRPSPDLDAAGPSGTPDRRIPHPLKILEAPLLRAQAAVVGTALLGCASGRLLGAPMECRLSHFNSAAQPKPGNRYGRRLSDIYWYQRRVGNDPRCSLLNGGGRYQRGDATGDTIYLGHLGVDDMGTVD